MRGLVIFGVSIQRKHRSQRKQHGGQITVGNDISEPYFYYFVFKSEERFFRNNMWNWRNLKLTLDFCNNINGVRYLSNKSACVTKIRRKMYTRVYPTLLVLPNGSTYTIRHFEPRRIIKLPLDIRTVSDELREEILERRKPKKKVVIEEEVEDDFDSSQYVQLLQKKKVAGKL